MASLRSWQALGFAIAFGLLASTTTLPARAAPVSFQNATATCSQIDGSGNFSVDKAINGIVNNTDGWAIFCVSPIAAQTAVFETTSDVTGAGLLVFRLKHEFQTLHTLGRFRLSVTGAARNDFADGLDNAGNLGADGIWTVLDPASAYSTGGATLTEQGDNSILAGGASPTNATYTVIVPTSTTPITGVRLQVLKDASLPHSGPGRQEFNGNFVLTELTLDAEVCTAGQFDVDDDNVIGPLTDALLVLRRRFGFDGSALITGALGDECVRCDEEDLAEYIDSLGVKLDIDGNGAVEALFDGLLMLRYAFGFRGPALIGGVVGQPCTRCEAPVIEAYLACLFA